MSKSTKKPLGRGLSSLLGENISLEALNNLDKNKELKKVSIDSISPGPWQVRRKFDELELKNLSNSIKKNGIFQPILVTTEKKDKNRFKIIAGERRWRAAQLAQVHDIPIIIRNDLSQEKITEISLLENLQRYDLNPIEEANGYLKLIEKYSYTQEQVSEIFGKSRPYIANFLRLLNLPNLIKQLVIDEKISVGHARAIINSDNPVKMAKFIVSRGLTVRQVEDLLRKKNIASNLKYKKDYSMMEQELSRQIGLKTKISFNDLSKKGSLILSFSDLEQLEYIIKKLKKINF